MDTNNDKAYRNAKKRVKKLRKFYHHLMVYVVINVGLATLNLYRNPENLWFLWVVFGWGIGLIMNAISVFTPEIFFTKQWEQRKIKEFMEKES